MEPISPNVCPRCKSGTGIVISQGWWYCSYCKIGGVVVRKGKKFEFVMKKIGVRAEKEKKSEKELKGPLEKQNKWENGKQVD